MTFEGWARKEWGDSYKQLHYSSDATKKAWNAALQEGVMRERERCLNIALAHSSIEGIAQTIADEISEGK